MSSLEAEVAAARESLKRGQLISLREYVDTMFASRDLMFAATLTAQKEQVSLMREASTIRLDSFKRELEAAIVSQKEAVEKAEEAIDKRLTGMNEFRQALDDQTKTMLTRIEYDQAHQSLIDKVDTAIATWAREHSGLVAHHEEDVQAIRIEMAKQPEIRALERQQFLNRGEAVGTKTERSEHRAITASQVGLMMLGLTVFWIIVAIVGIIVASSHSVH